MRSVGFKNEEKSRPTGSKYVFELFLNVALLLFALVIFLLIGYRETFPGLHRIGDFKDAGRIFFRGSKNLKDTTPVKALDPPPVRVVVDTEAATLDQKQNDTEPAKDKTGAVAVKVQY